jgi:hypothetical protein
MPKHREWHILLLFIKKKQEIEINRVYPKKRRKPYLRYLWLDLNKTKTEINHFKKHYKHNFFFKVIQGQMIVNFVFSNSLV